jgi:tetratricopeptide (TPR) repeat protein
MRYGERRPELSDAGKKDKNPMDMNKQFESALADYNQGKVSEAESILKEIVRTQPDRTDALYLLAEISYGSGNYDAALRYLSNAIQYDPGNAEAYGNLGFILQGKGRFDDAVKCYQKAIELDPNLLQAYMNLGNTFKEKGLFDDAVLYFQKALQICPDLPDAYSNIGITLLKTKQPDKAVGFCQKAVQLAPHDVNMYYNLGIALQENGRLDEAVTCYEKASQLAPCDAEIYNNLAFALQENRRPYEAIPYYRKALGLQPDYATARWNLALALLLTGNFREGWREYEWRWGTKYLSSSKRNFEQPLWTGPDIKGLTILLHAEQGLGDTFQFIRYAPLVAGRGAKVIFECYGHMASLMHSVEGIHQVIVSGEELPAFDVHCPLLSLPLAFDTTLETIPAAIPYISADISLADKWKDLLKHDNSKLKIGIVWAGNPGFKQNRYRNIPLHFFVPVAGLPGVTLYSLQKGEEAGMAKDPPGDMKLVDYTSGINDFSDTAAFIENLDLVISVDTAVAHLAGAIGKPVWTLLPYSPEWRWLMYREDSPWYPTMRLFRQSSHMDWQSVIDGVIRELRCKITG